MDVYLWRFNKSLHAYGAGVTKLGCHISSGYATNTGASATD